MPSESVLLNSSIAITATEAAVDIDNMLLGRPKNLVAMHRLAVHLRDLVAAGAPPHPIDSSIVEKIRGRIEGSNNTPQRHQILIDGGIKKVAELLSDEKILGDPNTLEQLERFCLALSQAIMSARITLRHSPRMPG